jgi:hypothetical protein
MIIQSEGCSRWMWYRCIATFVICICHIFALRNKPAFYTLSDGLRLWNVSHTALSHAFLWFFAGVSNLKPCQLVLTCSAFLLAVEHVPECTFGSEVMQCSSVIQTSSADDSLSCSLGTWVFSPGVKWAEGEADHYTAFSVQFKMGWAIHLFPFVLSWHE